MGEPPFPCSVVWRKTDSHLAQHGPRSLCQEAEGWGARTEGMVLLETRSLEKWGGRSWRHAGAEGGLLSRQ